LAVNSIFEEQNQKIIGQRLRRFKNSEKKFSKELFSHSKDFRVKYDETKRCFEKTRKSKIFLMNFSEFLRRDFSICHKNAK
jgi:hypothetical protein